MDNTNRTTKNPWGRDSMPNLYMISHGVATAGLSGHIDPGLSKLD